MGHGPESNMPQIPSTTLPFSVVCTPIATQGACLPTLYLGSGPETLPLRVQC